MFESNFPVDQESIGYVALWNTFKRIAAAAGYDRTDCDRLFEGTARAFYRI
jgi:predicted TIM-barrel fold metal-dependent hydrolase